jgi:hypothetical protein
VAAVAEAQARRTKPDLGKRAPWAFPLRPERPILFCTGILRPSTIMKRHLSAGGPAGFTLEDLVGAQASSFQLSNGDSTAAAACINDAFFNCFAGVIDTAPFTSFSIDLTSLPISLEFPRS